MCIHSSRKEDFNGSLNHLSTNGTVLHSRCTMRAATQMSTWQEDNADFFIHAHFAVYPILYLSVLFYGDFC